MTAVKKGIAGQCHMIVSQAQVHFLRLNSLCSLLTKQCRSKVRFIGGEGGRGALRWIRGHAPPEDFELQGL